MAKSEDAVKTGFIKIRVDPQQRADLEWAAGQERLELSTWLRRLGLAEADRMKRTPKPPLRRRT